jgi:nitronate monooxygenase
MTKLPKIIQGGMGAGVSSWKLARAVSSLGQLGVVSGIALDTLLARRLQDGDEDGSVRHALENFPLREMADRIWQKYFVAGGKEPDAPYVALPLHSHNEPQSLTELCVAGNFVEVFLAREGHSNPVGVNYLEKIQLPHLPSIYGAMLAGAAFVITGAGIAIRIPGVLDRFVRHEAASYELQVTGNEGHEAVVMDFDPRAFMGRELPDLERPMFLPIISSNVLAMTMIKRSNGPVDGFVVEGPTAGGHNAPPRGKQQLNDAGEPVYGDKDAVDLDKLRDLGLPFWIAGGQATPEKLREALACGAAGVQVGTAFAFCEESGLFEEFRHRLVQEAAAPNIPETDRLATSILYQLLLSGGTAPDDALRAIRRMAGVVAPATAGIDMANWGERYAQLVTPERRSWLLETAVRLLAEQGRPVPVVQYSVLLDLSFSLGFQTDALARLRERYGCEYVDYAKQGRPREADRAGGGAPLFVRADLERDALAALGLDSLSGPPSRQAIISAYRRLAAQHHPDRFYERPAGEQSEAAARFIEITHAYEMLLNRVRE